MVRSQRAIARSTLAFAPTRRAVPGVGSGFAGEAGPGSDARRPTGDGVNRSYAPQPDAQAGGLSIRELERKRDDCLVAILQALKTQQFAAGEVLRGLVPRHGYAPGGFDPPDAKLDDCSTQRDLDENGRAQAKRIGEAFRQNGIEVGVVLSSPRCRCLDTARLAFGQVQPRDPLQGALNDAERRQRQRAEIEHRVAMHASGPPLVLVTHGSVVTDLTGLDIRMGEFVVLRRAAEGSHAVAGQLYID